MSFRDRYPTKFGGSGRFQRSNRPFYSSWGHISESTLDEQCSPSFRQIRGVFGRDSEYQQSDRGRARRFSFVGPNERSAESSYPRRSRSPPVKDFRSYEIDDVQGNRGLPFGQSDPPLDRSRSFERGWNHEESYVESASPVDGLRIHEKRSEFLDDHERPVSPYKRHRKDERSDWEKSRFSDRRIRPQLKESSVEQQTSYDKKQKQMLKHQRKFHEKKSEASIQRFLDDCKQAFETKLESHPISKTSTFDRDPHEDERSFENSSKRDELVDKKPRYLPRFDSPIERYRSYSNTDNLDDTNIFERRPSKQFHNEKNSYHWGQVEHQPTYSSNNNMTLHQVTGNPYTNVASQSFQSEHMNTPFHNFSEGQHKNPQYNTSGNPNEMPEKPNQCLQLSQDSKRQIHSAPFQKVSKWPNQPSKITNENLSSGASGSFSSQGPSCVTSSYSLPNQPGSSQNRVPQPPILNPPFVDKNEFLGEIVNQNTINSDCVVASEQTENSTAVLPDPEFLQKFRNNPPSNEELGEIFKGFVIFFDVKRNSELEKNPFVVILDSFSKSDRFGSLEVEEVSDFQDFYSVPKQVCVLRWRGMMLVRAEGISRQEAREKAGIALINALAHHCYTVQTKYSYYCGGKLPKFMLKIKEKDGVYKVVSRGEIIKSATETLNQLIKQRKTSLKKGPDPTNIMAVLNFIDEFFKDKETFCELLFGGIESKEYTYNEVSHILKHVEQYKWLQSRRVSGYSRGTYAAVSRKHTPQQLCSYLLSLGKDSLRYRLIPPQPAWIELLTADTQYSANIVKRGEPIPEQGSIVRSDPAQCETFKRSRRPHRGYRGGIGRGNRGDSGIKHGNWN